MSSNIYHLNISIIEIKEIVTDPSYNIRSKFLQDDYNRYETARSRSNASQRQREEDERSRFSGYGDRPGSGVEFMPTKWHGGEVSISKITTLRLLVLALLAKKIS